MSGSRPGQLTEALVVPPRVYPLAWIVHVPHLACKALYVPPAVRQGRQGPGLMWSAPLVGVWPALETAKKIAMLHIIDTEE